jgi:hypothetical protein
MQSLCHSQEREEQAFNELARRADHAIDDLSVKIQESEAGLGDIRKEGWATQKKLRDTLAKIERKRAKLRAAIDLMRGKTARNPFLQAANALLMVLESPTGTDDQVRVGLHSMIAIARENAKSELVAAAPPTRPPIEVSLMALRERITGRRLQHGNAGRRS